MTVDLRLAVPAAAGWVAAAVWVGMPSAPAAVVLWAIAGICTAIALRWRYWALVAAAAVAAALCCTVAAVQAPARSVPIPAGTVDIVATTTQTVLPGRDFFEVRLTAVDGRPAGAPALVFGEQPANRLGIGTTIAFAGRLTAADPGDNISVLVFGRGPVAVKAEPPWFLEWANSLRERFLAEATALPGEGGDLLAGLAIGDTSDVDDSLDGAMKIASLTHLTAVSGANCAIVIGLIMTAAGAAGVRRGIRVGASTLVLLGFVILVTPEPSVLRAAVMAALVLATLGMGRPVRGLPLLSLATLVLIVVDPWLSRDYGFVLSVLATAGLLVLAGPLAGVFERWMPRWLALVIAVPLAAQLACQPVIVLLNASLPTFGVVANVLAAPAAPIATVVGLAACVLLAVLPPLGQLLCHIAWLPSAWIAALAHFFAGLPAAQLPWPAELPGVVLLVAVSALAVTAILTRRPWAVYGFTLAIAAYVSIAGASHIAAQLGRPDWQIAACDIGQGDAVFVKSADRVALIDTGPSPDRLTHCLTELGITHIDLLVLTHYDLDHVGGVAAVYGKVDTAFVGVRDEASDDRIVAELRAAGARVEQVARGPSGLLGDLRWQLLWPPVRTVGMEAGNPLSVTIEFRAVGDCPNGCLSSVFLGDLGEDAQNRLLAANPRLASVDVVKVSHHGSADQSERLYERLNATVGVIGVGVDNGYGHPNGKLLSLLAGIGTVVERTDQDGLVLLAPGATPGAVTVWTER